MTLPDSHQGKSAPESLGDVFVAIGCCRGDCALLLTDNCAHPDACDEKRENGGNR